MHKIIIFIMALILAGTLACQKEVDIAAEEEAIKSVLQKQLEAVSALDYEGEAEVWAHEPYIVHRTVGIVGWDSLSTYYKTNFREIREKLKEDPEYWTVRELRASNFDIHLNGNVAFVFYDEHYDYTLEGKESSGVSKVLKYLEKKEGEWKIVAVLPGR